MGNARSQRSGVVQGRCCQRCRAYEEVFTSWHVSEQREQTRLAILVAWFAWGVPAPFGGSQVSGSQGRCAYLTTSRSKPNPNPRYSLGLRLRLWLPLERARITGQGDRHQRITSSPLKSGPLSASKSKRHAPRGGTTLVRRFIASTIKLRGDPGPSKSRPEEANQPETEEDNTDVKVNCVTRRGGRPEVSKPIATFRWAALEVQVQVQVRFQVSR